VTTKTDFTPTGIKIEGAYENDRNVENSMLYKAIIREAYGVTDVICGHHLVYETREKRADGFTYEVIQEIPSADALIFDHDVAQKIWPENWRHVLLMLASTPVAKRDQMLGEFYYNRKSKDQSAHE